MPIVYIEFPSDTFYRPIVALPRHTVLKAKIFPLTAFYSCAHECVTHLNLKYTLVDTLWRPENLWFNHIHLEDKIGLLFSKRFSCILAVKTAVTLCYALHFVFCDPQREAPVDIGEYSLSCLSHVERVTVYLHLSVSLVWNHIHAK